MSSELIATLPLWLVIFLLSTTCHEAAHALVARWGGDNTAHDGGQVSLDPIPHIRRHPLGMLFAPIASFILNGGGWMIGWASAPYDPIWAARYPRRAAWMAAAGPAANLILVFIAAAGIYAGVAYGVFEPPRSPHTNNVVALAGGGTDLLTLALSVLFSLNLLLFTLNLLPLPPLDGSGVIGLFLPDDLFRKWQELFRDPMVSLAGLFAAFFLFSRIWGPIFVGALNLLYPQMTYTFR